MCTGMGCFLSFFSVREAARDLEFGLLAIWLGHRFRDAGRRVAVGWFAASRERLTMGGFFLVM